MTIATWANAQASVPPSTPCCWNKWSTLSLGKLPQHGTRNLKQLQRSLARNVHRIRRPPPLTGLRFLAGYLEKLWVLELVKHRERQS
jgi:hypothetical protein